MRENWDRKNWICKYNMGVDCDNEERAGCEHCGWCPEVEEERRNIIRKKYNIVDSYNKLMHIYKRFREGKITRKEAHEEFDKIKLSMLGTEFTIPQA